MEEVLTPDGHFKFPDLWPLNSLNAAMKLTFANDGIRIARLALRANSRALNSPENETIK